MYEYEFVRIEIKGLVKLKPSHDYHAIIEEYAKQGWRLVQVLAPPTGAYGAATYYEIIFERPKNNWIHVKLYP